MYHHWHTDEFSFFPRPRVARQVPRSYSPVWDGDSLSIFPPNLVALFLRGGGGLSSQYEIEKETRVTSCGT